MMSKFVVSLHGQGCQIAADKGGLLRRKVKLENVGFYTTRFIEATSAEEAASRATELVEQELSGINLSSRPPTIVVTGVAQDDARYDRYAPGGGFTWYREDSLS